MSEAEQKPSKKKFKYTKQLVRMALNDGWTQKDVATACRTQQSIVSEWKNGAKQGTEAQLKPLLAQYGSKLRRQTYGFYRSKCSDTGAMKFHRVEGQKILSVFFNTLVSSNRNSVKQFAIENLIVHQQGENKFVLAHQKREEVGQRIYKALDPSVLDMLWEVDLLLDLTASDLIKACDNKSIELKDTFPGESSALPGLIRKELLNLGIVADDIVDHSIEW